MNEELSVDKIIIMKKQHACGGNEWKIIRTGADVKLECTTCKRVIMLDRLDLIKRIKKVIN